jgi:hypothetical protein
VKNSTLCREIPFTFHVTTGNCSSLLGQCSMVAEPHYFDAAPAPASTHVLTNFDLRNESLNTNNYKFKSCFWPICCWLTYSDLILSYFFLELKLKGNVESLKVTEFSSN